MPPGNADAENIACNSCFPTHHQKYSKAGALTLALVGDKNQAGSWKCALNGEQATGIENPANLPVALTTGKLYQADALCQGGSLPSGGKTVDSIRKAGELWMLNDAKVSCSKAPASCSKNLPYYDGSGSCKLIGHPGQPKPQQTWSITTGGKTFCSMSWSSAAKTPVTRGPVTDGKCVFHYTDEFVNVNGLGTGGVALKQASHPSSFHYLTDLTGNCPTKYIHDWPITGGLSSSCDKTVGGQAHGYTVTGALVVGRPPSK